ncbi:MAG: asparagine synthase (glutamine-hydrolyzing) [Salinivirgaceae bacterium]|jgi:asparagine synthase (glutamine-hydrolysing)|nr:asparagine synthase (glutamine-hydrolyzing) [Salinivirgaceae bacterium]
MCGIAGYWQTTEMLGKSHLEKMAEALAHRGPDHQGIYHSSNAGLAHRRLSIIDLSDDANQPFYSQDGRYVMVYNGEVYNFKELAAQFHITPKTGSDSEIVLELFAKRGIEFAKLLNGMFAIAIYDLHEQRLFLFRDRAGIKPLFYYYANNILVFASELKALQKALPGDWLQKNTHAYGAFLHFGFIPAPQTVYHNIFKLEPGHMILLDKNGLKLQPWWSVESKIEVRRFTNEKELLQRLDVAVNSAVKSRLISDVPVGTFLSGGVDSSLVSAVAARHFNGKIKTFTIGFEHVKHNETEHAAKVARHIGSDHREFFVTEAEARELLPQIITQYDEPFADTSAIPTMLVSKMARQEVTVTLSGDGGDELFMGYGSHVWAKRLASNRYKMMAPFMRSALQLGNSRHRRAAGMFGKHTNSMSHIFSQEQYLFSENEVNALLVGENGFHPELKSFSDSFTPQEKQALFDFHYYLPDDLLTKVDRASMRYALETRVPLLDYRIVELAFNMHPSLRLNGKNGKYLLKKLLYRYVPQHLFDRPKQGFSVPLHQWMTGSLKGWFDAHLDESVIVRHGIVRPEVVAHLRKRFEKKSNAFLYNRLWAVAALHAWLEESGAK